jgi:hypothetical protein
VRAPDEHGLPTEGSSVGDDMRSVRQSTDNTRHSIDPGASAVLSAHDASRPKWRQRAAARAADMRSAAARVAILDGANAIKTRRGGSCSTPIDTAIKQTAQAATSTSSLSFVSLVMCSLTPAIRRPAHSGRAPVSPFRRWPNPLSFLKIATRPPVR